MQYETGIVSLLGNRESNQDRLGVVETGGGVVLVLGDGLGGKSGGELAASTLVETVEKMVHKQGLPVAEPEAFLREAIIRAHYAIRSAGAKKLPPIEPGSTAVICLVQNKKVWWAHVGDSRFYLIRDGLPLYRTQDHSYVEQLYQEGKIPLEKRQGHPMRNLVTQCIGLMENEPQVAVNNGIELQKGDVLLLCSDGFWEPLDDAQIGFNLVNSRISESINKLAQRAEQTSYPRSDNTSAVALRVISLQAVKKDAHPHAEQASQEPADALDGAIREIEAAIQAYADEMKKS